MEKSNFTLILTQPDGSYAVPDIIISDDFETSFSIQNAADISQRKDSLSKSITFPGTKNNNRIFNNLFSLNRDSDATLTDETLYYNYSPNIGVRAVMYENNQVIIAGTLKISDVIKDSNTKSYTYTGVITGKVVSFFGKISDLLLTDLDGFDEVLPYTWDAISNSWVFNDNQKFFFPMIDYGTGIEPNPNLFDYRNFRPAIYVRQFVKMILASQGYRYKSNFMDSDIFKRAFIPFQETGFGRTTYGNFATIKGGSYPNALNRPRRVALISFAGTRYGDFQENDFVSIIRNRGLVMKNMGATGNYNATGDTFRFKQNVSTVVNIKIAHKLESRRSVGFGEVGIYAVNKDTGYFDPELPLASKRYDFTQNSINQEVLTLNLDYRGFDVDYEFALICWVVSSDTVDFDQISIDGTFGNPDVSTGSFSTYQLGDNFQLSEALPKEQNSRDFLKSIFQFFNMYAIENPDDDNELIIEPYDVFYNQAVSPQQYALNWTRKIDNDSLHIKINTSMPKKYNFKFKEDTDFYNTLYKNRNNAVYGDFSIANRNGSVEPKNIEVVFSPTVIVREDGNDKTMPAIFTGELTSKKSYKSNLRILYNNEVIACNAYDVVQMNNDLSFTIKEEGVTFCQRSHHVLTIGVTDVFNLLFGVPLEVFYPVTTNIFDLPTLYTELYKNQLAELNNENIFTLELNCHLKETDISNLDLRKPIFISTEQGEAYFKIMNINYYSSIEVSKAVFQKIIL